MKRFARGALTLAFWLAVWAALALLVHRELLLPAPWVVVRRLCELAATVAFWRITAVSIGRVLPAWRGGRARRGAGVACTASKTADALLCPLMTVVKSTPVASFVVLALIWIARDWLPVFIALLMVLPVVWSNVCTGIRSTDPTLLELARVYGWPRGRVLRRIYVPGVRPHFLAALRSGIGFGWKAGIAAEVLTVPRSHRRMIYESKLYLQTTDLFAWTLAVILLSVGLERLVLHALTPRGKGGGGT
ncbi:MAG: ABC transporter permease [Oscillospiraceae bacterium]